MVVLSAATDSRDSATLRRNNTLAASRRSPLAIAVTAPPTATPACIRTLVSR